MSKKKDNDAQLEAQPQSIEEVKAKRTKRYTFPDIDGGGPSVTIEATSIEEATALFRKQKGTA